MSTSQSLKQQLAPYFTSAMVGDEEQWTCLLCQVVGKGPTAIELRAPGRTSNVYAHVRRAHKDLGNVFREDDPTQGILVGSLARSATPDQKRAAADALALYVARSRRSAASSRESGTPSACTRTSALTPACVHCRPSATWSVLPRHQQVLWSALSRQPMVWLRSAVPVCGCLAGEARSHGVGRCPSGPPGRRRYHRLMTSSKAPVSQLVIQHTPLVIQGATCVH